MIINDKIIEAREFFLVEDYPGNFFEQITSNDDYLRRFNILLFKQDLGSTSGFIGYSIDDTPIICINYNRSIGHQNFTLAHEIGHFFLHRGIAETDTDSNINSFKNVGKEKEANDFAAELLYPQKYFIQDCYFIKETNLLSADNRVELANFINDICHKYCISFTFVLYRILYKFRMADKFKKIRKEIEKALGSNISKYYDSDFYKVNSNHYYYKPYGYAYQYLKKYIEELVNLDEISNETAESILLKNSFLEEN